MGVKKIFVILGAGVEHVGGDMFISIPRAEAIFMKVRVSAHLFVIWKEPCKMVLTFHQVGLTLFGLSCKITRIMSY